MNFGGDKPASEEITKEEWLNKLQDIHITRADMNALIMNYLVTGITHLFSHTHPPPPTPPPQKKKKKKKKDTFYRMKRKQKFTAV